MMWFGGSNQDYSFEMFSVSHFFVIAILILGTSMIFLKKEKLQQLNLRFFEIGFAVSLILMEISYHLWMIVNELWDVSHAIPIELCNISLVFAVLLLLTRKRIFYEILLFTALLGASQAIFTPILVFDFPHYRFFHFFYTHLLIIWTVFYFTWVKGYHPTIWSVFKLVVFLNVLMPGIMYINKLVGGNYMFLGHKPTSASLLDFLGPYPWYIVSMEGLLITLSLIVWFIFREKAK